jgi:hypothetical protein
VGVKVGSGGSVGVFSTGVSVAAMCVAPVVELGAVFAESSGAGALFPHAVIKMIVSRMGRIRFMMGSNSRRL